MSGPPPPSACYSLIYLSQYLIKYAQNLFHNKFNFMPLHVSSTCAHHQEVKIVLHSLWYHTPIGVMILITKEILCMKLVKY